MKNIYLYFVICCGTVYSSFAQTGTIQGKVTDNGGNPIEFANIVVEGTTLGATSGTDGSYQVVNVPVGPVDLVVSSVQYETMTRKVRVSAGQTLNQDFTMTLRLTELGSVTVSGSTVFSPREITGATKLPVAYEELPLSAAVLQRGLLESRQFTRPEVALRMVAGLTPVASAHSQTKSNFLARGFFHNSSLGGILKDGKYYAGTDSPIADVASIERIEYLKGASSLLYGSAEPGGQLNYVYKQPLEEASYGVRLLAGSWNTFRADIDAGGPIIKDKLLYRATIGLEDSETWQDFSYNERIAPMLSLLYKITPRTTLQLTGELIINDANPSNTDAPVINAFDEDGSGRAFFFPVEDNWYGGFTNDFSEDLTQVYQASLRHEFLDNLNVTANLSWNRSERESGAGGYFSFAGPDNTFGSGAVNPEDGNVNRLVFDQARYVQAWAGNIDINYNISTGPIEHKIILGASYTGIETENTNGFSPLVPPGFVTEMPATNLFNPVYVEFNHLTDFQSSPPFNIQLWEEKEYGFYVQDLISLRNTGLKAMLGLRFNDYDFETLSSSNWAGEEGFFFPAIANTSVVPRVGLLYEFAPALSTYVSFSQSIVPIAPFNVDGTITEEDPKPITGEQWEVGFKGVLADKLTYTLALYQLDRQNVVVAVTPMTSAQDGLRRSRGIELDISGSFFERQNLYFSYGYTGTEIVESGVDDALEGERFNGVPEHFLSLWNTYQLANRLGFGVGVEHRSSWVIQPGSFGSTVPVEEDGYFIVNASLFYDIPMKKGKLDANFTINNIFDDYYFLPTENTLFVKRGAPVGFTFSVGYRFGANP